MAYDTTPATKGDIALLREEFEARLQRLEDRVDRLERMMLEGFAELKRHFDLSDASSDLNVRPA